MVFHKEPIITDRSQIVASEAKRRYLRAKLMSDVEVAKIKLHPRYRFGLWLNRNKDAATRVATNATTVAKDNVPLIAAIGTGALLYFARGPISKWISRFKKPTEQTED